MKAEGSAYWVKCKPEDLKILLYFAHNCKSNGDPLTVGRERLDCILKADSVSSIFRLNGAGMLVGSLTNTHYTYFGNPRINVKSSVEFCLPSVTTKDIPTSLRYRLNPCRFYVYICRIGEHVVYVGKGTGDRIKHVGTNLSHNKALTEFVKRNKDVEVIKVAENITEYMAVSIENSLIKAYSLSGHRLFNFQCNKNEVK